MQLLSQQGLDGLKQRISPQRWRSVFEALRDLVGWRPSVLVLPRSRAHWMKLDVRGVPSRFVLSTLRLQLRQFLGDGEFGFAYCQKGDVVTLWHWSEADENGFSNLVAGASSGGELVPWPESLLRVPAADGVHLVECQTGFEAVSVVAQEIVRTRWFATMPTPGTWALFVRDAGLDPEHYPLPLPREFRLQSRPPRGWKVSTHLIHPIPRTIWVGTAAVAVAGLLLVIGGSYSLKLDSATASERATYQRLAKENAVTIALQKQIGQKVAYLNGFNGARPPIPQLDLMKVLIESGLVTEESKISLAEWEYRNSRLRLLFSVPQEGFSLGAFLTVLEKQPAFRDIKLMPDTPPLTVGIQATVAALALPDNSGRASADTGVPVIDQR